MEDFVETVNKLMESISRGVTDGITEDTDLDEIGFDQWSRSLLAFDCELYLPVVLPNNVEDSWITYGDILQSLREAQ